MGIPIEKLLKVRRPEQPLLLLMIGTIALFQFCQIINENFSETVFLKRFGVGYLPTTYFLNSLVFLALLFALNPVVDRAARTRLVSHLLLVFAVTLVCLRLLVALGLPLAYPLIYIVVKQMKYVFYIVFWTLASDIYSTRKARRLFPLIGGGAVIGTIAGSLSSAAVRGLTGTDNVVLFTAAGMLVSWGLIGFGRRQVSRLSPVAFTAAESVTMASLGKFVRRELFGRRSGSLLGYLMLLALLPGIVGPIYEYVFNYLADRTYHSEASLFGFFGRFKGSFNILILACQVLVAGRAFRRFGIVNVLLAYPAGYLFAFGSLLASFRISAAAAGRTGIEVIDAAFYKPGCQMLYNIIPAHLRGRVSALVQGAVRRLGELAGSGLLWLLKSRLDAPRLVFAGPAFALAWLWCAWRLRRAYSSILYRSLSERHVDFAELEGRDMRSLMSAQARAALVKNLAAERPATALMAARLLSRSGVAGWPALVCAHLGGRPPEAQAEMVRLAAAGPPAEAAKALLSAARRGRRGAPGGRGGAAQGGPARGRAAVQGVARLVRPSARRRGPHRTRGVGGGDGRGVGPRAARFDGPARGRGRGLPARGDGLRRLPRAGRGPGGLRRSRREGRMRARPRPARPAALVGPLGPAPGRSGRARAVEGARGACRPR